MGTIRKKVTVELVADEEFFREWLEENDPDAENDNVLDSLVDAFQNHLDYKINMKDKVHVAYVANIVEVQ